MNNPSTTFWQGRRVLLTGHTGFKGSWLCLWLERLGAEVTGLALSPKGDTNLFALAGVEQCLHSHHECDIRDAASVASIVRDADPEVVFHLAAQPLVRASYRDPLTTHAINVQGTAHVLEALRGLSSIRAVVMATTDKVYRNLEQPYAYRETDELGGHDPYSASKAASELIIASYRDAFLAPQGVAVATARAGNVIGGGDWSAERLLPDAVRAWSAGHPLLIRRPHAIRPWQHVLEALAAYLRMAEHLYQQPELAGSYNFGPWPHQAATVAACVELARKAFGQGEVIFGQANEGPHEAGWLALETAKARAMMDIEPRWNLDRSVSHTMNWYRRQRDGEPARKLCMEDIDNYEYTCVGATA